MSECPVCKNDLCAPRSSFGHRDAYRFSCPHCGDFILSHSLLVNLPHDLETHQDAAAKISHALRRAQEKNRVAEFSTATVAEVLKRPLPRPQEQADLLIRWLAQNVLGPGEPVSLDFTKHGGIIGAKSLGGFGLVLSHLVKSGLLIGRCAEHFANANTGSTVTLSFQGWEYYERLAKGGAVYRKAFMAMKFGEPELESMFKTVFKSAAEQAGFDLFKLDDVPKAGLIDDRLRVEIQASDFLIADLTHNNLGAYWEAGYAEGLGKPVIYTCKRSKFKATKTHFDTNHHLTIVWDTGSPATAGENLKATIRATLPHLAKQTDGDA